MSTEIDNWAKKYEDLTNGDETIKAMAKYYTCSFMFDMEKAKVIIEMHDGKVKNINTNCIVQYHHKMQDGNPVPSTGGAGHDRLPVEGVPWSFGKKVEGGAG